MYTYLYTDKYLLLHSTWIKIVLWNVRPKLTKKKSVYVSISVCVYYLGALNPEGESLFMETHIRVWFKKTCGVHRLGKHDAFLCTDWELIPLYAQNSGCWVTSIEYLFYRIVMARGEVTAKKNNWEGLYRGRGTLLLHEFPKRWLYVNVHAPKF